MNKSFLIKRNNKEELGKYFLKKATEFVLNKKIDEAYEFIKEGLDLLTCDCNNNGWRNEYENSDKLIFTDFKNFEKQLTYYFVKAYFLSFEKDEFSLLQALEAINKYLDVNEDEYGLYVKGKILFFLEKYNKSLEIFVKAKKYCDSSRLTFEIGNLKEEYLNEFGINELFDSFKINPSSVCCAKTLQKHWRKRGRNLILFEETNKLFSAFLYSNTEEFCNLYNEYLKNEYLEEEVITKKRKKLKRKELKEMAEIAHAKLTNSKIRKEKRQPRNYNIIKKFETLPIINDFIGNILSYSNHFETKIEMQDEDYYIHTELNNNLFYNDSLDMDQQSPEFWDNL